MLYGRIAVMSLILFFCKGVGDHRDLHSFPTRVSPDRTTPHAADTATTAASRAGSGYPSSSRSSHGTATKIAATAAKESWNPGDRKSTRLNSSHANISYAVFCLKKKTNSRNRYECPVDT